MPPASNSHASRRPPHCPGTLCFANTITAPSSPPPKSPLPPLPANIWNETVTKSRPLEHSPQTRRGLCTEALPEIPSRTRCITSRPRALQKRHQSKTVNHFTRCSLEGQSPPRNPASCCPRPAVCTPTSSFQFIEEILTALPIQQSSTLVDGHRHTLNKPKAGIVEKRSQTSKSCRHSLQTKDLVRKYSSQIARDRSVISRSDCFQSPRACTLCSINPPILISRLELDRTCPSCLQSLFLTFKQKLGFYSTLLEWFNHAVQSHYHRELGQILQNANAWSTTEHKEWIQPSIHRVDIPVHNLILNPKLPLTRLIDASPDRSGFLEQKLSFPLAVRLNKISNVELGKPRLMLNTTDRIDYTCAARLRPSYSGDGHVENEPANCLHAHKDLSYSPDSAKSSANGLVSPNDSHKALFGKDLEADELCEKSIFRSRKSKIVWAITTALLVLVVTGGILGGLIWKLDHLSNDN